MSVLLFDCSTWNNLLQNTGQGWLNREEKLVLDIAKSVNLPKSHAKLALQGSLGVFSLKNRKLKRRMGLVRAEPTPTVPIPRDDRLSAIVPIDRICVEGEDADAASVGTLYESVRRNGVLQPLLLRRICSEDSAFGGLYLLIAGKKRLAAAKAAGHRAVPCYIVSMDAKDAAISAFLTDADCSKRDMFALSDALAELRTRFGMTVAEIAPRIGRSETFVAGKLLLQRYTAEERRYLREQSVSEELALILLQIKDRGRRMAATRQVCEKKMEVGAAMDYVRSILAGSLPSAKNAMADLRLFDNSVDRLMTALRRSGADATLERSELACETVVTIRIRHADATAKETT